MNNLKMTPWVSCSGYLKTQVMQYFPQSSGSELFMKLKRGKRGEGLADNLQHTVSIRFFPNLSPTALYLYWILTVPFCPLPKHHFCSPNYPITCPWSPQGCQGQTCCQDLLSEKTLPSPSDVWSLEFRSYH